MQDGEQPRDRRRLAGAGATREDGEPARGGVRGGEPLARVLRRGEEAGQRGVEAVGVDRQVGRREPAVDVVPDRELVAPVAVEVQRAPDPARGPVGCALDPDGDERAARDGVDPRGAVRPRQVGGIGPGGLLVLGQRQGAEVVEAHAHGAAAHGTDGERDGEQHPVVVLAREPAEPQRDAHVGGRDHARDVERRQARRHADGEPRVALVDRVARRRSGGPERRPGSGRGHARPPSSRADRATTSPGGGLQATTPYGVPSGPRGVSGPAMPRTNRYAPPARSRSGS